MTGFCYYCGENLQTDEHYVWCTGDQCEFVTFKSMFEIRSDGFASPSNPICGVWMVPVFYQRELDEPDIATTG